MREINTKCEKDNSQMFPIDISKMSNNELIKMVETKFKYKKPFILTKTLFAKALRGGYILFECPICRFRRMIKIEEIFINGYIDARVCKTCTSEICLWVNCPYGGYLKNE